MPPISKRAQSVDPTPFTGRPWYSVLVLAVALTLTGAAAALLSRAIAHTDEERFSAAVTASEDRIRRRMDTYVAMLRGAAGLFDTMGTVDRQAFSIYIGHIGLRENYPGIQGIGWGAPVPAGTEEATLRWLSLQGHAKPSLWPEHSGDRNAVLLLEPDDERNRRVIGLDMSSEPVRRAAMERARATGEPIATGTVTPFRPEPGVIPPKAFLIYLPIFERSENKTFRGFVYAAFRFEDLFGGMFTREPGSPLTMTIRDGIAAPGAEPMFDSRTSGQSVHMATRRISIYGQPWDIDYHSTRWFERQSSRPLIPLFTIAGVVLGFGLFLLARSQTRAVAQNARLYRESLAARREAEVGLQINLRIASDLDPQSVAQAVTDAGRELTGAELGAFFTINAMSKLSLYALSGITREHFATCGLPRLAEMFGPTISGQEVLRIGNIREDPRHGPLADGEPVLSSYLSVPVRSRTGRVLGGLLYCHVEPHRFTASHERMIRGLAAQAAIAFDNAGLFEGEREARRIAGHRADELTKANTELQQFVYVSSHDLQEPLRTITQYLDLLQRRHGRQLDDQARRYITYASESATRMYALLNDLLTYSRLGREAERAPVPLQDLIDEVAQDLRVVINEKRARLNVGELPVIRCERAKVRSVFQNLIGNALKFHGSQPPVITIGAEQDDDGLWIISVADNGIGINPEHHLVIFEVFERLHGREDFPGTGIGLAICKRVIEQHGGRIWVESTPGGGSTFRFTLPEDGSRTITALHATIP